MIKPERTKKIRNADFIDLGEDTKVKTDALNHGDGGKLITSANDTATIYSSLVLAASVKVVITIY